MALSWHSLTERVTEQIYLPPTDAAGLVTTNRLRRLNVSLSFTYTLMYTHPLPISHNFTHRKCKQTETPTKSKIPNEASLLLSIGTRSPRTEKSEHQVQVGYSKSPKQHRWWKRKRKAMGHLAKKWRGLLGSCGYKGSCQRSLTWCSPMCFLVSTCFPPKLFFPWSREPVLSGEGPTNNFPHFPPAFERCVYEKEEHAQYTMALQSARRRKNRSYTILLGRCTRIHPNCCSDIMTSHPPPEVILHASTMPAHVSSPSSSS